MGTAAGTLAADDNILPGQATNARGREAAMMIGMQMIGETEVARTVGVVLVAGPSILRTTEVEVSMSRTAEVAVGLNTPMTIPGRACGSAGCRVASRTTRLKMSFRSVGD
mmetsp:Transcript_101615/g.286544  ORF Transcript_101615/g.286544 Transcript_101615/m.286544 type:complete len:110 (+) Transcript_101615:404-733(+)